MKKRIRKSNKFLSKMKTFTLILAVSLILSPAVRNATASILYSTADIISTK